MTMMRRLSLLLSLLLLAATTASAKEKVLSKKHDTEHAQIEEELRLERLAKLERVEFDDGNVESFTCTLTGASGQDQCDAAQDDDGSKCVWCVLNQFGFCVSAEQAATFEQAIPTIDCDDTPGGDDDKAAADDDKAPPDDGPLWKCLESKDEASCTDTCVWCNTKGGFGVCLSPDAADLASDSYWFDCPADEDEEEEGVEDRYYPEEGEDVDDYGPDSAEEEEEEEEVSDWNEDEEEDDYEDDMHEFIVDTTCVLSGMLLDPADEDATSEAACFQARDGGGNPCEWCAVAGSPFRLCLSEPQAQVAEYVGAVCTGSDESFEPEEFDDSCINHMNNRDLSKEGCWVHQDLDGNGCEWCNLMGVELCLGGVQAELVEHWGATCVLDDKEHAMAVAAIEQHLQYAQAQKDQERIQKQAERIAERREQGKPEEPVLEDEEEDEIDLATLWLTSDPSCMVTTLRTSNGEDDELACAQTSDKDGHPCNWCQMGTSFYMCLNEEQADVAEYMGIECETISTDTQDILKEHTKRAEDYEDEEEEDGFDDAQDFDPSCIMSMQQGADQNTCVNTKDQDGQACEWCSWNQYQVCLASEQAEMVEPFGVKCDAVSPRPKAKEPLTESTVLKEITSQVDTSCLIDAGQFNDPEKCTSAKDAITGKPCEWCALGSLGVNACMSAEQAEMAKPLGVVCQEGAPVDEEAVLQDVPRDFWSCLTQSNSVNDCDETCTWCDLKNSPTGAGLCLSDDVADAVITAWTDGLLDCSEPEAPLDEEEDASAEDEEYDDDYAEGDDDEEEEGEEEDAADEVVA